jgi:hypothetical protein
MATNADESLHNVLVKGIIKDVNDAWERKAHRATLILVYCAIDALTYLALPEGKEKATRGDFVEWSDKYLRLRDAKGERTLSLPGLELYAARCALVHTYGSEADLHKEGKVKRQIGYADEMLPEIAEKADVEGLVLVSVRGLVDAIGEGAIAMLKDIAQDEARRKLVAAKLEKMVHELPA